MRRFTLIAVLATIAIPLHAQRMGAHFGSGRFSHGTGHGSNFPGYGRFGRGGVYYPYGLADFYPDYLDAGYPVASQPPVIVMQAPPNQAQEARVPDVHPLMIELQGDRYRRINDGDESEVEAVSQGSGSLSKAIPQEVPSHSEPRSAILVFRDGHREEVSDYTIAGGVLYAHADYYSAGSWTKNVDLAALNVPETMAANQSRGVPFRLPASPNEVMVGP